MVAGYATRHVASSAKRAGFRVCAVDHFCDLDLGWWVDDYAPFEDLAGLPAAIEEISSRNRIDHLVLTSGAEAALCPGIRRAGTDPGTVARFLDKMDIQRFFEEIDVPHPALAGPDDYPVMMKPRTGAGGWRNAVVHTPEEKEAWLAAIDLPSISQHLADGLPASVSCLSDGRRAVAVAANEQMLRGSGDAAFGFAGSITPCDHPAAPEMIRIAERIVAASGCVGSVGVDFLLSDQVVAIEINPRFQATLDTVERAAGVNLFSLHMDACAKRLPEKRPLSSRYAARRILFADRDFSIKSNLVRFGGFITDIPPVGTEFLEGDAVVSVFGYGGSRNDALRMLDNHINLLRQYIN
nr:ATP-grasp domain-containing protein [Methanocalculus sp. AMF5]